MKTRITIKSAAKGYKSWSTDFDMEYGENMDYEVIIRRGLK